MMFDSHLIKYHPSLPQGRSMKLTKKAIEGLAV